MLTSLSWNSRHINKQRLINARNHHLCDTLLISESGLGCGRNLVQAWIEPPTVHFNNREMNKMSPREPARRLFLPVEKTALD